ncbi:hypothetical protein H4R35_006373 [Dimargaris xerosporica]|nr:hypothetical protein H4R35_006373 [Dimargaris xerosporica]
MANSTAATVGPNDHQARANSTLAGGPQGTKASNSKSKIAPARRRRKKKNQVKPLTPASAATKSETTPLSDVDIQYVAPTDLDLADPAIAQFADIFRKFTLPGTNPALDQMAEDATESSQRNDSAVQAKPVEPAPSSGSDQSDDDEAKALSRNRLRRMHRPSVAQLKQCVAKPEVVDWVDTTALDPHLLVHLKGYRNTVPVPQHWSRKRKYLQGKRGIEKAPFELPAFIKDTGIQEMRDAIKEKEDEQKLKSRTRERVQPKMGKLGIDYQRLYNAFFRFQSKPSMTRQGELYYEGKEFETKAMDFQPGQLSDDLKAALNMPPLAPPPWLVNMQRYGPPPNYPHLIIPGLNAPIPEGAQWGFHPGGWGRPPVDEMNQPLYGNVFYTTPANPLGPNAAIERQPWGELESDEELPESESSEEESVAGLEGEEGPSATVSQPEAGAAAADLAEGLVTPSGLASVPSGLETPAHIELRKASRQALSETEPSRQLYQVLEQKEAQVSGFMGSEHTYQISHGSTTKSADHTKVSAATVGGSTARKGKATAAPASQVELALDPSEMASLDEALLQARYEATLQSQQEQRQVDEAREDFSDLVAEHASKQAKKRKKQADSKSNPAKKQREFKF